MGRGINSKRARLIREKLYMKQGGFCYYCLERMTMSTPDERHPRRGTLDHVKPRAEGGGSVADNFVLACFSCNQRKGRQREADFRKSAFAPNSAVDTGDKPAA